MTKQKRKRRRTKKAKNNTIRLLLVSVIFLGIFLAQNKLPKNLPTTSLDKEAVAVGIDISEWQPDVDFKQVKRDGYSFVIIRSGFGWQHEDVSFKEHYQKAKKVGLSIGIYHYSHATTIEEAKQEAYFVMQIIQDTQIDLPIFYDIETDRQNHLSRDELTQIVYAFLTTMESYGYTPGIYAAQSWYENRLDMTILNKYPIWIASYTDHLTYEGKYDYWQYTNEGSVNGVQGYCDLNVKYKKESDYVTNP